VGNLFFNLFLDNISNTKFEILMGRIDTLPVQILGKKVEEKRIESIFRFY